MNETTLIQTAVVTQQDKIDQIIDRLIIGEDHLSWTSLYNFSRSPIDFINYKLNKLEKTQEETAAMVYGRILHCAILEPKKFEERFFCLDDTKIIQSLKEKGAKNARATNEYKAWLELEEASAGNREVVSPKDAMHVKMISQEVWRNRASRTILDLCPVHEKAIEWKYKNYRFKGYIDGRGDHCFLDIKSMADAEKRKAQRTIIDRLYYIQLAAYQIGEGVEGEDSYIIAVDKRSGISCHKLDDRLLQRGVEDYKRLVDMFNICIAREGFDQSFDFWAQYLEKRWTGIFDLALPGWMLSFE